MKYIKKRNGDIVADNPLKMKNAIDKVCAQFEIQKEKNDLIFANCLDKLNEIFKSKSVIDIETVSDIVEEEFVNQGLWRVAKAYSLYRMQYKNIEQTDKLFNDMTQIIDKYLNRLDWRVSENSNMTYSIQGLNNYVASSISANYWLNKIYPKHIREAHNSGDFHIHDLNILAVYCCGWDLFNLLANGFRGVPGKVECKPPKHFRTALGQIVNFFYTLQGEAAGAQAFSNFDTYLAPFIYYDKLDYEQIKQSIQEFIFNLNIPTRVGFQTPFTNITMDLQPPDILKNQFVIIGGEIKNKTYGDFQEEMNLINKAFAEVMLEGDASGRVFSFPIPTYNITKDFEWDNPNYELIWKMTAKYGTPYFSNFVNSDMNPEDARSMCCRLRLDNRELLSRGGGLFGANPLTGSIGVVTINLPRIGYIAKNKEEFFNRLGLLMDSASESLEIKRRFLEATTQSGIYPYAKYYLKDIYQKNKQYWINHFSTIGLVGGNECCLNFLGKDISEKEGKEFAVEILNFMRERIRLYQEKTGNLYNLESTPAEGTSYRLARLDRKMFPMIAAAGNGIPYYSNSTQLPVDYSNDIFTALNHQDDLQVLYTGGTVFHIFLKEEIPNVEMVKSIIKKVSSAYKLPYFTLTPTFSVCSEHGYFKGKISKCPVCGRDAEIFSRIVGYLRPVSNWNEGKQEEFKNRFVYESVV
ncbi:MAG TPA: ribonucleoside triphosphate reductase [bacterium]|nr:ribonucleoside triphosphate reductase [bacterium]HPN32345.1 ribonucleoside triphosphate reductase [bacterium]